MILEVNTPSCTHSQKANKHTQILDNTEDYVIFMCTVFSQEKCVHSINPNSTGLTFKMYIRWEFKNSNYQGNDLNKSGKTLIGVYEMCGQMHTFYHSPTLRSPIALWYILVTMPIKTLVTRQWLMTDPCIMYMYRTCMLQACKVPSEWKMNSYSAPRKESRFWNILHFGP